MACPCHTYEQHVLSPALQHFLVTPLITLPEFKCVGNPTIFVSQTSALGLWQLDFFLYFPRGLNDQHHLWCGIWKVHLECFRPLILCDHMAVLSIVDQFHPQTVDHIFFCDAYCPHSGPNILLSVPWTHSKYSTPRLPIDLDSPGLFLIFHTYFYGNHNPGFNFSLAEHFLELLLNEHLRSA